MVVANDPPSLACILTSASGDNSKRLELQSLKLLIPDEVADFHAKSVGYDLQRLDRHVALATLDGSHERPVHSTLVREGFLGKSMLLTQFPNPPSERQEQSFKGIVHVTSVRGLACLCLQCLHRHCLHSMLSTLGFRWNRKGGPH